MKSARRFPFLLVSALLAVAACNSVASNIHNPMSLERIVVADNFASPWGIAFLDSGTALVTEKEGGLVQVDLETGLKANIAGLPEDLVNDIRSEVSFDNSGLFDVAVDPMFDEDPWVYISYAAAAESGRTTKVIRARLLDDKLQDIETLLIAEPFTKGEFFHYGGGMCFGANGKLFVTVGERIYNERDNPAVPIAQNPADLRGKIYRLNRNGSVPDDNPDFGPEAVPGLYAIGIRAAQGITLNAETGDVWFSEHGSRRGDEINRLVAGGNYGWPIVTTGDYRNDDFEPPEMDSDAFERPVWAWQQTVAPTGLTFYSGEELPEWQGDLLVSGLSRGSLWRFNFESGTIVSVEELFVNDRIRSRDVAVSPDGALYILTDTLLVPNDDGGLDYTEQPSGQLLRIQRSAR